MMKARVMISALLCSLAAVTVGAQNVVEQMNEVKGDANYCYGEGANTDAQKAYDMALEELVSELSKKVSARVNKEDVRKKASKLERKRGEQIRMLVYVPLAQFNAKSSTSATNTVPQRTSMPTATQTGTTTVGQQTTTAQSQTTTVASTNDRQPLNIPATCLDYSKAKDVVSQMKMVKHTNALKKLLAADLEGGLIKSCGTPSNAKDMDNVYWWVFRKGEPMQFVTVLSPVKANGKRDNLETGEEQTLLDFQGAEYGTVWFTLP